MRTIKSISTDTLAQELNNPQVTIVDIRPVDAYNGWRVQGESRGGHIPGARSLPVKWTRYLEWPEIVQSKNIHPEQRLIVYGYPNDDIEGVIRKFERLGFTDVCHYGHFRDEWTENPELPMDRLPRYRHLVSAPWVRDLISGKNPEGVDGNRFLICHAHYRNPNDYRQGHIPGAIALDTLMLESPETWNRRSPEELKTNLERLGITHDSTVVLYGRFAHPKNDDPFPGSSAGHLGAIRCAFILLYAGVKDVKVLNGGLQSWEDAGFELEYRENQPQPVADFGGTIPARPELAVDLPEAKHILKSENANLVSVRSWQEYIGEVSGYNYIEKKGRIPGSVFANCGSDAYHMENYRNLDHTTREYHEIEQLWFDAGITPDKHNAFYCGTGWRGSEAFFNAFLMGWDRISVYDGGWFEWSQDPRNPIETGVPSV